MLLIKIACTVVMLRQTASMALSTPPRTRRWALEQVVLVPVTAASAILPATAVSGKCADIESCREEGERKMVEIDKAQGPVVTVEPGIRYRELKRGEGPVLRDGDTADIRFQVLQGNGYFMYSIPNREPGSTDLAETYRVTIGNRDVPEGVEKAMIGASRGSVRRVELPPKKGFGTSEWRPEPTGYAGIQRMKRYRAVLSGNGLQPGYDAVLLFEFDIVKVRPSK